MMRSGMSAVVVESLKHTNWAHPLHVLTHAPGPNASVSFGRPRLPKPPPRIVDAQSIFGGVAIELSAVPSILEDVASELSAVQAKTLADAVVEGVATAAQGETLADAAVKGVASFFERQTDRFPRNSPTTRPYILPHSTSRRLHKQATRRLLFAHALRAGNDTTRNMLQSVENPTNSTQSSTEMLDTQSINVGLSVTVVALLLFIALGFLRRWWQKESVEKNLVKYAGVQSKTETDSQDR
jgi:hypothetical protein